MPTSYTYINILLLFLYHISTTFSKSLSDSFSGDSIATCIFIKWDFTKMISKVILLNQSSSNRNCKAYACQSVQVWKHADECFIAHVIEMPCLPGLCTDKALVSRTCVANKK